MLLLVIGAWEALKKIAWIEDAKLCLREEKLSQLVASITSPEKSTISRYYNCFKKPSSQLEALLGVFEIWNIQVKSWNDSGYFREINEI